MTNTKTQHTPTGWEYRPNKGVNLGSDKKPAYVVFDDACWIVEVELEDDGVYVNGVLIQNF
ncbi:hypothetical protein CMI37_28770 [Candidatus Pacearchaeota archaeon]|nr:hypothetical protein [Candidatus Pacearchaeota archaeon]|tara:strand:+ start:1458 stop:1640 length:183 start_codon:yes stop_codon:yes gene_type:complete